MSEILIDSAVLIDYIHGHVDAAQFLNPLYAAGAARVNAVVVADFLEGARNRREQDDVLSLLKGFAVLDTNSIDIELSLDLLARFKLSHGIGWGDCLIAATAMRHDVPVATTNVKHFSVVPGLRLIRPY